MSRDAFDRLCFSTRQEWLIERQRHIQASDSAAIDGSSPWKTAAELYDEKTGIFPPEDISQKPYIRYGIAVEPLARDMFILDCPYFSVEYHQYDILVSREKPWMGATLDGELTVTEINPWGFPIGTKGIYEGKTGSWVKKANLSEWDGTDSLIPPHYYSQAIHQLAVTGWDFVIFSARLRRDAFRDSDMGFPEIIQLYRIVDRRSVSVREDIATLEDLEERFWKESIQASRRPPRRIAI